MTLVVPFFFKGTFSFGLFVSAEFAYKPWLKVLLIGWVREKNIIQTVDYKPDTSE